MFTKDELSFPCVDGLNVDEMHDLQAILATMQLHLVQAIAARERRMEGLVSRALKNEAAADTFYQRLPVAQRW